MTEPPPGHDAEFAKLVEAVRRLPRSIEPPRDLWPGIAPRLRRRPAWGRWAVLAAAAAVIAAVGWRVLVTGPAGWVVVRVDGAPRVGGSLLGGQGRLRVGETMVTDDSSRARVAVGSIGSVDVLPGTELRLVAARPDAHRLALARGTIYAAVTAPPRLFIVETPSATAVDLGCAYTLAVDSTGASVLHVTAGYVELDGNGRRSIVPIGAFAVTRPGLAPGTPVLEDAPAALRRAVAAIDFETGGAAAVRAALTAARAEDATTLWHLMSRVDPSLRPAVYDRLAALVPPPAGTSRAAATVLDPATLDRYWQLIRRIQWRREILKGIKEVDPRTGLAR
jgi:FecR protein